MRGPNAITPERLDEVENMLGLGSTPRQIQRMCATKWGCTQRTVRTTLAKVRKRLAARSPSDLGPEALHQLETIFRQAVVKGDLRTAGRLAVEKCRIGGLYPRSRHEISGPGGAPLSISPDDAAAWLRREIDKVCAEDAPVVPPPEE